jgi:hypothetical protein
MLAGGFVVLNLWVHQSVPALSAGNDSATPYLIRIRDAAQVPSTFVWELPAHESGYAITRDVPDRDPLQTMVNEPATIEVLTENCEIVASWTSSTGGVIAIDERGGATLRPGAQSPPGDSIDLPRTRECDGA